MYAGFGSTSNTTTQDNDNSLDIPAWKKQLIMKKRAGNVSVVEENSRRNLDSSASGVNITRNGDSSNTCGNCPLGGGNNKFSRLAKAREPDLREISPPKTVTIGNINVELRSVKPPSDNHDSYDALKSDRNSNFETGQESDDDGYEDLQYGPGIVDRLRARFLNMGAKTQHKPVVRRFSSLENLPGSNSGPYRVNARSVRHNGFKFGSGPPYNISGNVKKAQSMETLLCNTSEHHIFAFNKRSNARYIGGVKARIFSKNISPISIVTDESDTSKEKTPSPSASPRQFNKCVRRWDYSRSASAPNINEDELPKPDTVKHVKKIFESPPVVSSSEKTSCLSSGTRFRKIPSTITTPTSVSNDGAILGRIAVKKPDVGEGSLDAKSSAKEFPDLVVNNLLRKEEVLSSAEREEKCDDGEINEGDYSSVLDNDLSANRSCDTSPVSQENVVLSTDAHDPFVNNPGRGDLPDNQRENNTISELTRSSIKVTPEQLPLAEEFKHTELLSQGRQVSQVSEAEKVEDDLLPHPQAGDCSTADDGMVVAAAVSGGESASDSCPAPKKGSTWQKAPASSTSIVFDFRGKDVKPNISLNPTPFGCRPAKVSRNSNCLKKRSNSPPRAGINGVPSKEYIVDQEDCKKDDEDEEDWDELDVGADLPRFSGIVFTGENIKVGRGALLETRNKKVR
ncbi:uncharacterized protein LOC118188765, partial [Stegodyphus dumicola]|uniref:uncharacterized protein LOC118188765 n=1 Tax=Stegodyphus dumicola TaxID=202533 RepID=UPI0015A7BEC9